MHTECENINLKYYNIFPIRNSFSNSIDGPPMLKANVEREKLTPDLRFIKVHAIILKNFS